MARNHKLINESSKLDETTAKIYSMLLEKFGEPIHDQPAMVGARDEGPGGKALWDDEPKHDRDWSDGSVVHESDAAIHGADDVGLCQHGMMKSEGENMCQACASEMMPTEMYEEDAIDEVTPPGKEKMVKALKKQPGVKNPWAVAWSAYNKEHGKKPKK